MPKIAAKVVAVACVLGGGMGVAGCVAMSRLKISDDYGQAVRQDVVAQVADPDAQYKGTPAPGSNGDRVGIAQARYNNNAVIRPASTATSNVRSTGGGGNGGGSEGGNGSGAGVAAGPP